MESKLAYLQLIKFRYHITFLTVVFAALIFGGRIDASILRSLFQLYLSFDVLFYGGIYTFNDLRDLNSDKLHPRKKNRPVASGRVSVAAARRFATVLVLSGLMTVLMLFGWPMFLVYGAILLLNVFYSLFARNVPYLDIAINAATHPFRFLLGVLLTDGGIPLLHMSAYFFFVFGLCCLRRELEKDIPGWEARQTLKAYSPRVLRLLESLSLILVLVLFFIDGFISKGFYSIVIATYLVVVLGARWSRMIRQLLYGMWTR